MAFGKSAAFMATTLDTGAFWPDLALGDFQRDYRIPADYAIEAVEHNITLAFSLVIKDLSEKKKAWINAGYASLAEVPQATILDKNELEQMFLHAVFSMAKAKLLHQFHSMTRKETANALNSDLDESADHWLSEARKAIKHLLAKPNVCADLM